MSNPSVCFLAVTEIDGVNFRVEDNLGEAVHIHMGKMRIALSVHEFYKFADGIMAAAWQLFHVRHLSLETLDIESLKKDWVKDYNKIQSMEMEYRTLDSLYMKESYVRDRAIKRIIPLKESGYVKVLKGDRSDVAYYEAPGKMEPSRKQKLDFILQKIEAVGYPWENKLILADQDGYIYDGVKRASCLYYLYGGCKRIPILCIHLPKGRSIEELQERAEGEVRKWEANYISDMFVYGQQERCGIEAIPESERVCMREFIRRLTGTGIPFFLIKKQKKDRKGKTIADAVVIVEEGKLNIIQKELDMPQNLPSPYEGYEFIYTALKPLSYLTTDGIVLVFDRLCCSNRFEKYILPVDGYVLKESQSCKIWSEDWQCYLAGTEIHILMILVDTLFEQGYFERQDIDYIERNRKILEKPEFNNMLEKVFYKYSHVLIGYLLLRDYDRALSMYEKYSEY